MKKRIIPMLLAILMVASLIPNISYAASRVQEGKVQALKELNLFQGSQGNDDLDRPPTHAESAVMLVRLLGKENAALAETHTHPFTDVPKWANSYVGYAYANNLVHGVSETKFGPDEITSAPLFLTYVLRALGYDDRRGDFDWNNSIEVAKVAGILDPDVDTRNFKRSDAASVCYSSLRGLLRGTKTPLSDKLISEGVFTKEMLTKAQNMVNNPRQAAVKTDRNYKFYAPAGSGEKVVYLTFDDGPSPNVTPRILDTLKQNDVKATFFVVGSMADKHPELVRQAYDEGHVIANHSYTHDYKSLYAAPENLVAEIKQTNDSINNALGFDYGNQLFRFPGGSSGKTNVFKDAVYDMGYQYIDWNCSGGDATSVKGTPAKEIISNTISSAKGKTEVAVLFHDTSAKSTTADALPAVIKHFKDQGYTFKTLAE